MICAQCCIMILHAFITFHVVKWSELALVEVQEPKVSLKSLQTSTYKVTHLKFTPMKTFFPLTATKSYSPSLHSCKLPADGRQFVRTQLSGIVWDCLLLLHKWQTIRSLGANCLGLSARKVNARQFTRYELSGNLLSSGQSQSIRSQGRIVWDCLLKR